MHVRSSFGSAVSCLLILNRLSCMSWALAGTTEIPCVWDLDMFPRKRELCLRPLRSRLRTGMLISVILFY